MVFRFLYLFLLFRSKDKKNTWSRNLDENNFRHGYGNYFKIAILKVTWYQLFWKFSAIMRHIDKGILKTPYSWRFYEHGSTYVFIFLDKYCETKRTKIPWKLLVAQKSEPFLWRTLHHYIPLIIKFLFFFETNLVFWCDLVLIE